MNVKTNLCIQHGNSAGPWTSGITIGHISWKFGKKYLSFPQILQFVTGIFKTIYYQKAISSFIEVGHFGCFNVNTLCGIKLENMNRRAIFELWCSMRPRRNLSLDQNIVRSSCFSIFIFVKNVSWCSILCERLRLCQTVIWKIVFDVVSHIERK